MKKKQNVCRIKKILFAVDGYFSAALWSVAKKNKSQSVFHFSK